MATVTITEVIRLLADEGLNPHIDGSKDVRLAGFCSLARAKDGHLTWSKTERLVSGELPACIVIAPSDASLDGFPGARAVISTSNPKAAFFSTLATFWGREHAASVAESAVVLGKLAERVSVGEHTYIGPEVCIGAGTVVENNVSICGPAHIGEDCIIHSGAVIGADGFGYYFEDGVPQKVEHYGGVFIGNRVEIGANACIDRGTIDDTTICNDVKIDNLVHIAHNVVIEDDSMVIAGAIVCGSAHLGTGSYIAPGGIVKNQVRVGNESLVGLGGVLTRDLDSGLVAIGIPAKPLREIRSGDK